MMRDRKRENVDYTRVVAIRGAFPSEGDGGPVKCHRESQADPSKAAF